MKPVPFGNEIIYASEIPYADYDEFLELAQRAFEVHDDQREKKRREVFVDLMARFAVREDGSRRFTSRDELTGLPGKAVLKAVYSFATEILDLNTVTEESIEEARKN